MRDFLSGVVKIKKIMSNTTVFVCRACGMSHSKFNSADKCCKKQIRNKSGQFAQGWRNS